MAKKVAETEKEVVTETSTEKPEKVKKVTNSKETTKVDHKKEAMRVALSKVDKIAKMVTQQMQLETDMGALLYWIDEWIRIESDKTTKTELSRIFSYIGVTKTIEEQRELISNWNDLNPQFLPGVISTVIPKIENLKNIVKAVYIYYYPDNDADVAWDKMKKLYVKSLNDDGENGDD